MNQKLSLVETSEVLIDFFNSEINKTKKEMNDRMDQDGKDMSDRFDKLMMEELTHEKGFFGKQGSIMLTPPPSVEGEEGD